MIDNLYGIISLVSFIGIVIICATVSIPHDYNDIKRMMQHT